MRDLPAMQENRLTNQDNAPTQNSAIQQVIFLSTYAWKLMTMPNTQPTLANPPFILPYFPKEGPIEGGQI